MRLSFWRRGLLAAAVAFGALTSMARAAEDEEPLLKLRIMETTDLHVNMVNYDYFADRPTDEYGFAKTAALIRRARAEAKNSLLFDNGDLIQGNPLGDYVARVDPLEPGETHPVYKALNLFGYDAGNIGNHEFNYGLEFLEIALAGARFPYVNANVYVDDHDGDPTNDQHYFTPYVILDREFADEAGRTHALKVGVIGFVPPQVMAWDKAHLEGRVIAKDIVATARELVPRMKAEGADLIIAIPHSGFDASPATDKMENATYYLSEVPDIDVILFGHAHRTFPDDSFEGIPGVDAEKGTINGVPAVMPGFWGNHLGIVDLELRKIDGKWEVVDSRSELRPIYDAASRTALADADPAVLEAVKEDHERTLEYIRGPVGQTTAPINSFFALFQDDPSVQIVNDAQMWYIKRVIEGTEYDGLPVLSAAAPFKAGGRQGPGYYTNIPEGPLAIKNVADLYLYSNTVYAVLLTGAEVKEWLEWSAGQFNSIDPASSEEQPLVNSGFPTYNFDVIDGVTYEIDVTQPPRYDASGRELINPDAHRIVNLRYNGEPIDPEQTFVVATNNYRASSSPRANPDGKRVIVQAPDENRQIIIDYIRENRTINPSADGNWKLADTLGSAVVTYLTSPDARPFADALGTLEYVGETEDGYAKFRLVPSDAGASDQASDQAPAAPAESPSVPAQPPAAPPAAPDAPATDAPAADAPEAAPAERVHIVRPGDTLFCIALSYGITWRELARYNALGNPHLIYPNQTIRIPPSAPAERVYIVQPGDTLSHIALKHGLAWQELARYNAMENPHLIYPDQIIRIPPS